MDGTQPLVSPLRNIVKDKWTRTIGLVSLVSLALGSFNDTMEALEKIYNISLSQLTDIPSRNKLSKIYIRASASVLDENFGAPVYIKRSSSDEIIKYYLDDNYLLSAITSDDAIVAYLVFPSLGYEPNTVEHAGQEDLFKQSFSTIESINEVRASYARTGNYYMEENNGGQFGFLYSSVSGFSEFLSPMDSNEKKLLSDVVDAQMFEDKLVESVESFRENMTPNFFGYTTLGLASLEEAVLSITEYKLILKI
ncbi:ETEC_3214 domain-containing protein [Vibrio sp. F74]|uniref:ETEC_3214 domain-containing protein n=1 Tax=Vibrio sp. F74 TaxID=700020 RepID=UPI0035F57BF6